MEYPKIETVFDRDPTTFHVIPGKLRLPEFELPNEWLITEKIDGTNIRVLFSTGYGRLQGPNEPPEFQALEDPHMSFGGRTDQAQIPPFLLDKLREMLPLERLREAFDPGTTGILFGEGYGARIQKGGGNYRPDVSFRLFDVVVYSQKEHPWWLNWENVEDVARKLFISTVPVLDRCTLEQAVEDVRHGFGSETAQQDMGKPVVVPAEGIVARTEPLLFMRDGRPLMWKLKTKDFDKGR